jgi:hypothetical protein
MAANAPEKQKKSLTWRNIEGKGDLENIKEFPSWRNEPPINESPVNESLLNNSLNKPPTNKPMPTIVEGTKGILYKNEYDYQSRSMIVEGTKVFCKAVEDTDEGTRYLFYTQKDIRIPFTRKFAHEYGTKWWFRPEASQEGAAAPGGQRRSRKTRRQKRRSRKTRR